MIYFVQANEYGMNMHAKIHYMNIKRFLLINPSKFELWEFYIMPKCTNKGFGKS
jgi:hypothetical protein